MNLSGWIVAIVFWGIACVAQIHNGELAGQQQSAPLSRHEVGEPTEIAVEQDGTVALPQLPEIFNRITNNRYFEIVSEDYASLQTVAQIAQEMGDLGSAYYSVSNRIQPILVQLRQPSAVSFHGDYQIRPQANGEITIDIKWSELTEIKVVSQALASGFLNRVAIARFGLAATSKIPDWLELAFSELLLTKLRPAYADYQLAYALRTPMLLAEQILTAQAPLVDDQAQVANNAYFLFKNLEYELAEDVLRRVLLEFLANRAPWEVMQHAFPQDLNSRKTLELWWAVAFQNYVRSRQGLFYAMRESREWIERLSVFTLELDGKEHRVQGPELWEMQHAAGMDLLLFHRLREIKLQMQKVNPVYFNALLSLGLIFEALQVNSEQLFVQHYQQFLDDYENAVKLETEIMLLLDY